MTATLTFILLALATAADGLLAGASLDQSIKQVPARHQMGTIAFSVYSRASDLSRRGILWYALLGVGAAILTIAAAITAFFQGVLLLHALPIYLAAGLSVLHSLTTSQAAPTNFQQRKVPNDEAALTAIFDRFERWQTLRAVLQVPTFGAMLWAFISYIS